ncbi:MAG: phosphatase PAP2 family protein [Leptospiraceae bacterium]|nr:phosphatase PAP2 family protein [Leptospiraceae bacterium]
MPLKIPAGISLLFPIILMIVFPFAYLWNVQLFQTLNCQPSNSEFLNTLMLFTTMTADGFFILMFFCFWAPARTQIFISGLIGFLCAAILTQILKSIFDSPRPPAYFSEVEICVLGFSFSSRSFPSGHATAAFALARFVFQSPSNIIRTLAILFGIAGSFSRVYTGVHFPADIVAGAFIGWVVVEICIRLIRVPESKVLSMVPWISNLAGISASLAFLFLYEESIPHVEFLTRPLAAVLGLYFFFRLFRQMYFKRKQTDAPLL